MCNFTFSAGLRAGKPTPLDAGYVFSTLFRGGPVSSKLFEVVSWHLMTTDVHSVVLDSGHFTRKNGHPLSQGVFDAFYFVLFASEWDLMFIS